MDLITTTAELTAVCARLAQHPVITVDTEFLRETTYYPLLCVVQLASPDEAVVIDALADGHRPYAVLRPDGERRRAQGLPCRAAGYRDHLASGQHLPHPIFDTQVAAMVLGYGDSIAYDAAGRTHHRPPARQDPPLHRLVAPAADEGSARLRRGGRHPSARCLRSARRRSQETRPQRLGQRGNGSPHLAENLRLPSRARLGAIEDPRSQTEGTRRPDGSRRLARAGSAEPRRSARRACSRTTRSAISPPTRPTASSGLRRCARCQKVSTSRNGAPISSPPFSAASPAIRKRCPRSRSPGIIPMAQRPSNCSRFCCA